MILHPPDNDEWHDPLNLKNPGYGYRFLLKGELFFNRNFKNYLWMYSEISRKWMKGYSGLSDKQVYRVPKSLPFYWDNPTKRKRYIEQLKKANQHEQFSHSTL